MKLYEVCEIDANDRVTILKTNQTELMATLAVERLRNAYGKDGLRFTYRRSGISNKKINEYGNILTDLLLVLFGVLSIGFLTFTLAGLPAMVLLATLAEVLR